MTAPDEELRAALRHALDRFIDPDDDTMPALNRVEGGFTWVPADRVLDDLMKIAGTLGRMYLQAMADLGRAIDDLGKLREDNERLRAQLFRLDNTVRRLRADLGAEAELREERTALYDLWRSKANEALDKARKGEAP